VYETLAISSFTISMQWNLWDLWATTAAFLSDSCVFVVVIVKWHSVCMCVCSYVWTGGRGNLVFHVRACVENHPLTLCQPTTAFTIAIPLTAPQFTDTHEFGRLSFFKTFMTETNTSKNFTVKVYQFFRITEFVSKAVKLEVCQFFTITANISK